MHLERRTIVTRPRSLMDFSLRCARFYPGVNSRAELVTLAFGSGINTNYRITLMHCNKQLYVDKLGSFLHWVIGWLGGNRIQFRMNHVHREKDIDNEIYNYFSFFSS